MLMSILRSRPSRPWRRLLGVAMALPLLVAGLITSPAQAEPAPQAPTDSGITVSGSYNPGGSGCHGKENSAECLSWGLRVPSTIAPKQELTVTVEAHGQEHIDHIIRALAENGFEINKIY